METHDLILNAETTLKVSMGISNEHKAIAFKQGRNIIAIKQAAVWVDDEARQLKIYPKRYTLDTDQLNHFHLIPERINPTRIDKEPDYVVEGPFYEYYSALKSEGEQDQASILFKNAHNGIIDRLVHELEPRLNPATKVFPFGKNGAFTQPMIATAKYERVVTPGAEPEDEPVISYTITCEALVGARPFVFSLDGSSPVDEVNNVVKYENLAPGTYNVHVVDQQISHQMITVVIPEERASPLFG
jgi:hypothetical protein